MVKALLYAGKQFAILLMMYWNRNICTCTWFVEIYNIHTCIITKPIAILSMSVYIHKDAIF